MAVPTASAVEVPRSRGSVQVDFAGFVQPLVSRVSSQAAHPNDLRRGAEDDARDLRFLPQGRGRRGLTDLEPLSGARDGGAGAMAMVGAVPGGGSWPKPWLGGAGWLKCWVNGW
eukprot:Skav225861  [mRNA]  locus=scaffold810:126265:128599:+ [translate_table: standard]